MRQLAWMAEDVGRERWDHTSAIMAMINNANPYRSKDIKPSQLNPYLIQRRQRRERTLSRVEFLALFGGRAPQVLPPGPAR
jgi:hypothetical protein